MSLGWPRRLSGSLRRNKSLTYAGIRTQVRPARSVVAKCQWLRKVLRTKVVEKNETRILCPVYFVRKCRRVRGNQWKVRERARSVTGRLAVRMCSDLCLCYTWSSPGLWGSPHCGEGLPCEKNALVILTKWLLYIPLRLLKNLQSFAGCVYVFCVDLRTDSDYFPTQH
jgi:hypothetical protein